MKRMHAMQSMHTMPVLPMNYNPVYFCRVLVIAPHFAISLFSFYVLAWGHPGDPAEGFVER